MPPAHLGIARQGERVAQVAPATGRIQPLLRCGVLAASQQGRVDRQCQRCTQPGGEHPGLVETALAQTPARQRHRQQRIRAFEPFAEGVPQMAREAVGQDATQGPARLVLETIDQGVDRKGEAPGHLHPIVGGRMAQAFTTRQARSRQRQGADRTVTAEPWQLSFTGVAKRSVADGLVTQQAKLLNS